MDMGHLFPWKTAEALLDYRLAPGGKTWKDVVAEGRIPNLHRGQAPDPQERKYLKTGFATPSGKVEFYSSTLKDLGFDPLPCYREAATPDAQFPLSSFVGLPDDEYFRTGQRHVPELRHMAEDPMFFMNRHDSDALGIVEGDWVRLKTKAGAMPLASISARECRKDWCAFPMAGGNRNRVRAATTCRACGRSAMPSSPPTTIRS